MKRKAKKAKPVKAWAAICFDGLNSFGLSERWHYPIFHTRKDARHWLANDCGLPSAVTKISRVIIKEI